MTEGGHGATAVSTGARAGSGGLRRSRPAMTRAVSGWSVALRAGLEDEAKSKLRELLQDKTRGGQRRRDGP